MKDVSTDQGVHPGTSRENPPAGASGAPPGSWREVLGAFLRLGLISFGGPWLVVMFCAAGGAALALA
jgi:hypothetical protein